MEGFSSVFLQPKANTIPFEPTIESTETSPSFSSSTSSPPSTPSSSCSPDSYIPTPSHDPELDETLDFMTFSHIKNGYQGLTQFSITYPSGEIGVRYVLVEETGVTPMREKPKEPTCVVHTDRDTFFQLYLAEISPKKAIIAGLISVDGWRYRELASFANSFDTSSQKWADFYESRGIVPKYAPKSSPEVTSQVCNGAELSSSPSPSSSSSSSSSSVLEITAQTAAMALEQSARWGYYGVTMVSNALSTVLMPTEAQCAEGLAVDLHIPSEEIEAFQKRLLERKPVYSASRHRVFNTLQKKMGERFEPILEPLRPGVPTISPSKALRSPPVLGAAPLPIVSQKDTNWESVFESLQRHEEVPFSLSSDIERQPGLLSTPFSFLNDSASSRELSRSRARSSSFDLTMW